LIPVAIIRSARVYRKDCDLVSAKFVSEFASHRHLKAPQQFDGTATLSEDDSLIVHLKASCDVAQAAYASIVFMGKSPSKGKVVMLKGSNDAQTLKGKLKVAELKPLVRLNHF
jgi:hypothetical protein